MEPAEIDGMMSTRALLFGPSATGFTLCSSPLFTTTASIDLAHPFYHSSFSCYPFLQLWQKNGFNCNTLHCAKHEILITGPSKYGKNFNLLCFYRAVPFRPSSGLGVTWGKLVCSGCSASVTDASHLFWGMKQRDASAPTGGPFFFFLVSNFGEAQIAAGDSHRSMKRIIMHEPLTQ